MLGNLNRTLQGAGFALAVVAAMAAPWQSAQATSARPHPFTVEQPDGTRIVLHVRGNPAYNWQEDINGFTVLEQNGRYVYARRGASGQLEATDHEVGKADPRAVGLSRREMPSAAVRATLRAGGPAGGGKCSQRRAGSGNHVGAR